MITERCPDTLRDGVVWCITGRECAFCFTGNIWRRLICKQNISISNTYSAIYVSVLQKRQVWCVCSVTTVWSVPEHFSQWGAIQIYRHLPPFLHNTVSQMTKRHLNIIAISGLHHYECVVPLTASNLQNGRFSASNLQNGRFSAILTASVNVRLWDSRSFRTVFIHVIRGRPPGLFQSSDRSAVRIFLASALSSNHAMCQTERVAVIEQSR